jgi:zinc protease
MSFNRKVKPESKASLNFSLPVIDEFTLSNGLKVLHIHKNKLPLVRLNLILDAGSKYDSADKNGLAYLTSLAIDEGVEGLSALELSDQFDVLGSHFSIMTDNDSIQINLQSLSEHFQRSLELFSKVIISPSFNEEEFLREKKKLLTRIIQNKDEPDYLADQIFDNIIFSTSNPYSFPVMGYEESVNSITRNDVKQHFLKFFLPSNSVLVIAGNIEKPELSALLEKYLNSWRAKADRQLFNGKNIRAKKKIYLFHKEGSVQTEIRVGHVTEKRNQTDFFQRHLFNSILGGQFTSRINLNLREKNGYTYGAQSRFQYLKDVAYFQVATSVGSENTTEALNEILFELENIKLGVTEDELSFAKSSLVKKFPLNFETYRQIIANITGKILFDLPDDYYDNYITNVEAVTLKQVDEAAKKFIYSNDLVVVLVGDKNKILDKLTGMPFDISEVNIKGELIK